MSTEVMFKKELSVYCISADPIVVSYYFGRRNGGYLRRGRKDIIITSVLVENRCVFNALSADSFNQLRKALYRSGDLTSL